MIHRELARLFLIELALSQLEERKSPKLTGLTMIDPRLTKGHLPDGPIPPLTLQALMEIGGEIAADEETA